MTTQRLTKRVINGGLVLQESTSSLAADVH